MIKKLYPYARGYKKETAFAALFVSLEVLFEVSIPYIMAKLIDYGIYGNNKEYILKLGLLLIVVSLVSLIFGMLSANFASTASSGFAKNLRSAMYRSVMDFSYADIDKFSTSGIITRLTQDTNNLRNSYLMLIRIAMRCPVMFAFSMAFAIRISGKLSLIYVVLLPILVYGLLYLMKVTSPLYKKVYTAYDKLNLTVQENLRGIKVVKSFSAGEKETEKFEANTNEICYNYVKAEKLLAFSYPLMQLSVNTSLVLISWFGAHMIVSGTLMTGELTSLISYSMQIFMSLRLFITVMSSLTQSSQTAKRALGVISYKSTMNALGTATVENTDIMLKNVCFAYGDSAPCLSSINLSIPEGSTIGIIGSTGCGKSTLSLLMSRLYDPTSGTVFLGGRDIREYDIHSLRKNVVSVLQENVLFSGSVRENLVRGAEDKYTDDELWDALRISEAECFVREYEAGLSHNITQFGSNLSGGQRQRLCIARAILRNPRLIIFDDSTSAIDVTTEAKIRRNLNEDVKYKDATKIFISQRILSVKDCDKIIVMCSGGIESYDTHENLKKESTVYMDICNTQRSGGAVI